MTSIYWDCFSGIAGNMAVASLLDIGANKDKLEKAIASIDFEEGPVKLIIEERMSHGIRGLYFNTEDDDCNGTHSHEHSHHTHHHVHNHEHLHDNNHSHKADIQKHEHSHEHAPHRGYTEIAALINKADISHNAQHIALDCFKVLGEAEAKIHGKSIEEIHFHEVGARDSIADIVGIAVCLDDLGIDEIFTSKVSVGSGMVNCAHGLIPIPAPATAMLLKNLPIVSKQEEPFELTTPTGAAILKGLKAQFGMPPGFSYSEVGHGLGSMEIGRANFLRAFLSSDNKKKTLTDEIIQLETNVDNVTGELLGHVTKKLMDTGALDVSLTPMIMKKGRPAHLLTVISSVALANKLEQMIFNELPTLGIRKITMQRSILEREHISIQSNQGLIKGKKIYELDGSERIVAEFDDKISISEKTGQPVRNIVV